jgi:hypothetical protein
MTGYQNKHKSHNELLNTITDALEGDKEVLFSNMSLMGAGEIYKKDCQVSMLRGERIFRMVYDSRRKVVIKEPYKTKLSLNKIPYIDMKQYGILETEPFINVSEAKLDRLLMATLKNRVYSVFSQSSLKPTRTSKDSCIRSLLRCALYTDYIDINQAIDLIIKYKYHNKKCKVFNEQEQREKLLYQISCIKLKGGGFIPKSVPDTEVSNEFFDIIQFGKDLMLEA